MWLNSQCRQSYGCFSKSTPKIATYAGAMTLSEFESLSAPDLSEIISGMHSKTCELDTLPTAILKTCLDILIMPILQIVNLSLSSSIFPDHFKHACIRPLLKSPTADQDAIKNYRPISNLSFLSKVIESNQKIKSNLHYTRRITPKRVTSCGAHLRGLAPGLHSSKETSQRWRVVGDTVPI